MFHTHEKIIRGVHANAGGFQLHNRVFHLPVALFPVLTQIDFFKKSALWKNIKLF
jgi:hypothetical protein